MVGEAKNEVVVIVVDVVVVAVDPSCGLNSSRVSRPLLPLFVSPSSLDS